MKKIYIIALLILITAFAIADIMNESGRAGKTGSPGENNCTGCHTSFAVNSGPGSITISSPNLTNWEYVLGQTYQINITVAQTTIPLFGFGFEALRTSNNTSVGSFVITNTTETQLKGAIINGANRINVVHKKNGGLTNDTHTFSFNWTAPTTNIGNIKFYAAGNASDNQADSLNDFVYTTSQLVTPFATGISESGSNNSIQIFPNPAHDFLSIKFSSDNSSTYTFQLFNCFGQLVLNERKESISGGSYVNIRLPENIENGIYFLKTIDENNKSMLVKVFVYN